MTRRTFSTAVSALAASAQQAAPVRLGIDLFSLRNQGWTPFQYLDYCARWKAKVVHFSEIRFLGSLEPALLKQVRAHAEKLGLELEIGMRSICPTSKAFDAAQGTAEQQLLKMLEAAKTIGAPLVRAFLGTMADRNPPHYIEGNIENTVKVLRSVRNQFTDAGKKIAIENHAGDMQGRELKTLIEEAGKDFVGACIDSGNPLWTIEDPHLTLETLAPYCLTSHVRDSAVWRTPEGVAVRWTRMGEGNVNIREWVRSFQRLCPGRALSLEIIVTGSRPFPVFDPKFWEGYKRVPAWEFSRFLALADKGQPQTYQPPPKERAAEQERLDLEASATWVQNLLNA